MHPLSIILTAYLVFANVLAVAPASPHGILNSGLVYHIEPNTSNLISEEMVGDDVCRATGLDILYAFVYKGWNCAFYSDACSDRGYIDSVWAKNADERINVNHKWTEIVPYYKCHWGK
ncbi:hypothetical protein BDV96DRAFT_641666 [Lophiotrema nucula]|uniref:Uncharacterized protein n=1 Tax=Lophiotrema nucula TaxID=690887 RepID=A0A6A5ZMX8_9PLEO|nr:hypothetical protein BDV96DRAFT_641666 [Lophiotrema nucula]